MTIKIDSTSFGQWISRQTPNENLIWKGNNFVVNNDLEKCDYWVVYEDLHTPQTCLCNKDNTILITGEPPSIKTYTKDFLKQFRRVVTCHREIDCESLVQRQQSLPWLTGIEYYGNSLLGENFPRVNFDYFSKPFNKKKKPLVSTILSTKQNTKGHLMRREFILQLKSLLGDSLIIFGPEHNYLVDKIEAIEPFEYHLSIENSSYENYWTEKLSDAFLGESLPIYYGCPNIKDYFPTNSLKVINLNAKEVAIEIKKLIKQDFYRHHLHEVRKAKELVLNKYNLFAELSELTSIEKTTTTSPITILPQSAFTKSIFTSMPNKAFHRISSYTISNIKYLPLSEKCREYFRWKLGQSSTPHKVKQTDIIRIQKLYSYSNFIETGTYKGEMISAVKDSFDKLISIELDQKLAIEATELFSKSDNVLVMQGDSATRLKESISIFKDSILFWLDGHYSGPGTARGNCDTPVFEELRTIWQSKISNYSILIDDARLFNDTNGYPSVAYMDVLVKNWFPGHKMKIHHDIIFITPQ